MSREMNGMSGEYPSDSPFIASKEDAQFEAFVLDVQIGIGIGFCEIPWYEYWHSWARRRFAVRSIQALFAASKQIQDRRR